MPRLTIDGRPVEVKEGATILEAAGLLGITIPRFCHHPALPPAGSCRMCVVEIEGSPKLATSCSTPAAEGMKVSTSSPAVKAARRDVLEFLLLNHPLDCPICDQAGECSLQDYYMEHSCAKSRFPAELKEPRQKRRLIGPHLVLDNERCVLCTRCVRFCDEVTRTSELFVSGRSDASFIDIREGKALDNGYSLNLADICPVGALTSREFRFRQRAWFLEKTPVTCLGCATGCRAEAHHAGGEIYRMVPAPGAENAWLCDRGRLTYRPLRAGDRLKKGFIKNGYIDLEPAVREAAARLAGEPGAAVLGSPWLSVEDNAALAALARALGTGNYCFSFTAESGIKDGILVNKDPAPNTAGAAEAAPTGGLDLGELNRRIAAGEIKALITEARAAAFIKGRMPDGFKLIVFATNRSEIPAGAYATLPYASYFETPGTFVNYQGRRGVTGPVVPPPEGVPPLAETAAALAAALKGDGA